MEFRTLGMTGLYVSTLSFGASSLGGVFGVIDETECDRSVAVALDLGINLFDVAPFYGATRAESALGRGLSPFRRESYILETKVGRYGPSEFDFSAERITREFDESLRRLRTDYVDIVLCHDIEFGTLEQILHETLPALERLRDQGKLRFVGVSGLPLSIFPRVLAAAKLDCMLSYCHFTLADSTLSSLFHSNEVGLINASPLGMGLLTHAGPPEWHPAPSAVKEACRKAATRCFEAGIDISELALQHSLSAEQIATTLIGMSTVAEVERNVRTTGMAPNPEALALVRQALSEVQGVSWPSGREEWQS